ncbi:MAG: hypothetical protein IT494_04040 [Gammaproteobacteria bacterium]|nr:hypothetical protein [Gammaproteobacteria bacterium]
MVIDPVSLYAAATFVWAAPRFTPTHVPPGRQTTASTTVTDHGPPDAGLQARMPRDRAALAVPYRSALEALIVQMGGAARPSGKGVFIDLRV